jgi:hypothetical protein
MPEAGRVVVILTLVRARLLKIAAFASAIVAVLSAAIWVHSWFAYFGVRRFHWNEAERRFTIVGAFCHLGMFKGAVQHQSSGPDDDLTAVRRDNGHWEFTYAVYRGYHWGAFSRGFTRRWIDYDHFYSYGVRDRIWQLSGTYEELGVGITPWLLMLLSLILPTVWLRRHLRQRHRRTAGLCPACGYDLRATPGHCPECGLVTKHV